MLVFKKNCGKPETSQVGLGDPNPYTNAININCVAMLVLYQIEPYISHYIDLPIPLSWPFLGCIFGGPSWARAPHSLVYHAGMPCGMLQNLWAEPSMPSPRRDQ